MAKIPPLMLAPPILFAGLAAMFFWGMNRDNPNALPSALIGQGAPAIVAVQLGDLATFDGSVFSDGKVKLVNFWASWCAPCRVEHPNLIELAKDIPVYGINKGDQPADALKFLDDLGNPFIAVTTDYTGRQSIEWGVYGLPETFVLDGEGKIVLRFVGAITQRRLQSELLPAIQKARAAN